MPGVFKVILSQTIYLVSKFPINRLLFELLACWVCQREPAESDTGGWKQISVDEMLLLLVLVLSFPVC